MPTDRSDDQPPPTPHPSRPVRARGPRPTLKLHRDETDAGGGDLETYKFPAATPRPAGAVNGSRWASRTRLVAAKVCRSPLESTFDGSACGVVNGGDDPDCIGRIVTSSQLVREIEQTLDRMQNRLSEFRGEVDRAFKFPQIDNNDDDGGGRLPPAA